MHEKRKISINREYEKPRLRMIELAAEEVLSLGCKVAPAAPGQASPVGCATIACSLSTGS